MARSGAARVEAKSLLPRELAELDSQLAELLLGGGGGLDEAVEASIEAYRIVARAVGEGLGGVRGQPVVMFSGGKDSLVALDLAHRALGPGRYLVAYIEIPGNTHEENVGYAYKIARLYGLEPGRSFLHLRSERHTFYELVERWGWPGPRRRWCMTTFKTQVVNRHLAGMVTATGVKAGDSGWRRSWARAGVLGRIPGWRTIFFKPIIAWTTSMVLEYVRERRLPLNPLYETLGGSANCVYCPYNANPEYYRRLRESYPNWWARLLEAEARVSKGKPFYQGRGRKLGFEELASKSPRPARVPAAACPLGGCQAEAEAVTG